MSRRQGSMRALVSILAASLLAGACVSGDSTGGGGGSGSVTISGSSTVEPISAANAEKFASINPDVQISVDGPGTGDGFSLFCEGETDISDASRTIKPEEIEICEENGIEFIELKVAVDGIAVLTSPENDFAECLSFIDLYSLLGIDSEGFDSWADANPLNKKLGGAGDFPNKPLPITAPGEESGTFDSFIEIALEGVAVEEAGVSEDGPFVRPDYQASSDDNVIIQGITGNDSSLGWVGFAFFANNAETVQAIPISEEEGGTCVEPDPDTISSGEYPIARDLYIYVNKGKADENAALVAYVDFYLSEEGMATVPEVGYVSLDESSLVEAREIWENRTMGAAS